ncbi:MAG: MFS transporter [Proteobacteria bacterium]|nr:MFS transporter [Pseudomonadota bacterium]
MTNDVAAGKLMFKTKLGYGTAELSSCLTWTMIAVFFMFFLTDVVGIDPAFAGFILMIGTLWDAVTDPMLGIVSDRMKSKWGRRRPFILGVAIPYGVITWLLFTDFSLGSTLTKVYFIFAIILYYSAATILEVPYTSLAAEMTQDYDERTSLFSYRAVFSQIASIIGAAAPPTLVAYFGGIFGDQKMGWSVMTAIFGVCSIFPILWTWRSTRGHEIHPEKTEVKLMDIFHGPLKNKTFLYTTGIYMASNIGLAIAGAVMVYFMKYFMEFDENQQSIAFVFLFACTIFWIPLVAKASEKYGKRGAFMIFIGGWAVLQTVGVALVQPAMMVFFFVLMVLSSGGVVTVTMTGWSMIPDAIEVDEFKSGQRREGLYVGVLSLSRKVSVAFVLWLVGIVLSSTGYIPNVAQSEEAIFGIRILYAQGTAAFLFLGVILAYFMPMTAERHRALKEAIRLKQEGKPWDEDSVSDIV